MQGIQIKRAHKLANSPGGAIYFCGPVLSCNAFQRPLQWLSDGTLLIDWWWLILHIDNSGPLMNIKLSHSRRGIANVMLNVFVIYRLSWQDVQIHSFILTFTSVVIFLTGLHLLVPMIATSWHVFTYNHISFTLFLIISHGLVL